MEQEIKSEKRFCLYTHSRPDNGIIFYVGIGTARRPYRRSQRGNIWHKIVDKNKGEFIIDVLCENESWDSVCQMEIALIKHFGRLNKKTGCLANLTDGGDGTVGLVIPPERLAQMAKQSLNYKHTEESRRLISNAHKGKPKSLEHRNKIKQSAGRAVMTAESKRLISEAQKGRVKPLSEKIKQMKSSVERRGYIIKQVSMKTGRLIDFYVCSVTASEKTGCPKTGIAMCVRGEQQYAGGFYWLKHHDLSNLDKLLADKYDLSNFDQLLAVAV